MEQLLFRKALMDASTPDRQALPTEPCCLQQAALRCAGRCKMGCGVPAPFRAQRSQVSNPPANVDLKGNWQNGQLTDPWSTELKSLRYGAAAFAMNSACRRPIVWEVASRAVTFGYEPISRRSPEVRFRDYKGQHTFPVRSYSL